VVTSAGIKSERKRSLKRKLFYAAIPTILAFLIVEGLFRLYSLVEDRAEVGRRYETLSKNPAYKSNPWFTREFVASAMANDTGYYAPRRTRLVFRSDYQDQFFTVRNGIRATVGFDPGGVPPGRRPRKLLLLGGSTTYCGEVPDDCTYASLLQKRLAAIPETRDIEVVNCGIGSAVSLQEVERLEYEIARNNIPDFCLFFDGINDANQGVFNGNPQGTLFEARQDYLETGLLGTLKRLARVSVAARTIYHSVLGSQERNDPVPPSEADVRELANATADCYERNMLRAKEICDRYRIRTIVFLQPNVYSISGRPRTSHEQWAAGRMRRGLGDALQLCYPFLREKLGRLRQRGILAYDISDAFNDNLEPIFVDGYHVECRGNGLIAEAILKKALPVLKDSSSQEIALPVEPNLSVVR
jgi:hypothetical protein